MTHFFPHGRRSPARPYRSVFAFLSLLALAIPTGFPFATSAGPAARADDSGDNRLWLVTAHMPDTVAIVDAEGKILWSLGRDDGVEHPQDACVMPDGNLFLSVKTGARMVRVDTGELLWKWNVPEGAENPVAQPLGNGRFLVGAEGPCELFEINGEGRACREIQIPDCPFQGRHGQFRFCRKTSLGTYLVPMISSGVLREYSADGTRIRQIPQGGVPVSAVRLPNGDTLTGNGTAVEIYNSENMLVWRFDAVADGGMGPGLVAAVSLLRDGSVLFGYYQAGDEADFAIVSRDKKIALKVALPDIRNLACVQLLDRQMKPSGEVVAR